MSSLRFMLHRMFGPIRRFTFLEEEHFICIVKTPGFSKEDLTMSITPNELIQIAGRKEIYEGKQKIQTLELEELVHIPEGISKDTIQYTIEHGTTTIRCHRKPTASLSDLDKV